MRPAHVADTPSETAPGPRARRTLRSRRALQPRPGWRDLAGGLIWRARAEGFAGIFAYPFALVGFVVVLGAVSLWGHSGNLPEVPVGGPFGVHSRGAGMNLAVLAAPGLLTLGISIGAGRTAQSLIGSESSTGTFEMLLAQGFGPRGLARAVLAVVLAVVAALWLAMTAVSAGLIGLLNTLSGAHLHLTGWYLAMTLALPPLTAASGTCLAAAVGFAAPAWTQPAERGVAGGAGGVVGTLAALPGIANTVVVLAIAGRISALGQFGLGLLMAAAAAATGWWVIRSRFGYDGMLRSH